MDSGEYIIMLALLVMGVSYAIGIIILVQKGFL